MDIIVEKLSKNFGDKTVFKDFSAKFDGGKVTAVTGKSGIGKTTLLNCIAGLLPYDGKITGAENGVSYVFQEDRLIPLMTVYDNLSLVLSGSKEQKADLIKEILGEVELTEKATDLPETLSGGQKKRVSLARAYVSRKDVILLDEPLNSLDLGLKTKMNELFLKLEKKFNPTAVYCTHDLDEAFTVSDKIIVLGENGVVYSHEFSSDKYGRDIFDEECNKVRKEITEILKG